MKESKQELKFEKNKEMKVGEWDERVAKDELKGQFNPEKDFKGEIYIEAKELTGPLSWFCFDMGVRITVCPYADPNRCPWLKCADSEFKDYTGHAIEEKICTAVLQTNYILLSRYRSKSVPMCKTHLARRERLDVEG